MYEQEESIYKLISEADPPPRQRLKYKSIHPPDAPPTYSTFCLKTTSMPGVANAAGDYKLPCGHHTNKGMTSTFGLPEGMEKPKVAEYTKKGTGIMKLPESNYSTDSREKVCIQRYCKTSSGSLEG